MGRVAAFSIDVGCHHQRANGRIEILVDTRTHDDGLLKESSIKQNAMFKGVGHNRDTTQDQEKHLRSNIHFANMYSVQNTVRRAVAKETENKNNQGTGEKLNSRLENAVGRRPARYVLQEGTKQQESLSMEEQFHGSAVPSFLWNGAVVSAA